MAKLTYWLVILALAEVVFGIFLFTLAVDERYSISTMVYGTAYRPYAYRMLLPFAVRLVTPLVPMPLVNLAMTVPPISLGVHLIEPGYEREWLLMVVGMYASLIGYLVAFRQLMAVSGFRSWAINGLTFPMLFGLTTFVYNTKVYDFTSIFLFTLGLTLLAQRRDRLYLVIFVLGCFNKETIILLALVAFHQRRSKVLLAIQLAIFGLARAGLMVVYFLNHGAVVERHFNEYVAAFMASPIGMTLPIVLVIGLIKFRWGSKPPLLRATFLICFPVLAVLSIFWGYPFEYRVFLEVYPAMFLLIAGGLFRPKMLYEEIKL